MWGGRGSLDGRWLGIVATALAALGLVLPATAAAQTFTVTNLADSGEGSLRDEVDAANANPGPDAVAFAVGLAGTITLSGSGLQITDPLDLEGPGPGQITVAQSSAMRVFHVNLTSPGAVTIAGLHIAGGTAPNSGSHANYGGDILNDTTNAVADLTISNSVISGGRAPSDGGGIESLGAPLTLLDSTVTGNRAAVSGGIEAGNTAGYTIAGSTISGNVAEIETGGLEGSLSGGTGSIEDSTIAGNDGGEGDAGGAHLYVTFSGSVVIRDSTVTGNVGGEGGSGSGGGLWLGTDVSGRIAIEDSTIAANRAEGKAPFGGGGGIAVELTPANVSLVDTIVAGNLAASHGPDVDGPLAASFSLIGNPVGATVTESVPGSDLTGLDPLLGPLQDNGGPTQTMALTATSPAVNRGGGALASDQRGAARPVLYPGVPISAAPGANGADIGAYELQAPAAPEPPPSSPPAPAPLPSASKAPRVRVSCPRSAAPQGCSFKLQVFSAKPRRHPHDAKGKPARAKRPVAESTVAKLELAAGKSALVTLVPKPKFAASLAAAKTLLVREVETVAGKARTRYRRLKAVR